MVTYMINALLNGSSIEEALTVGIRNAMKRGAKYHCVDCGLGVPRYVGRYPQLCPECGGDLKLVVVKEDADHPVTNRSNDGPKDPTRRYIARKAARASRVNRKVASRRFAKSSKGKRFHKLLGRFNSRNSI